MAAYDSARYDPPAPVARVALREIDGTSLLGDVPLLIDSGADVTLLPRAAVARLGVVPLEGTGYELIGFDGAKSSAAAADLDMIFLGKAYRGRYLLIEDEHGVLGRDVLANVTLRLDGPNREWSELTA